MSTYSFTRFKNFEIQDMGTLREQSESLDQLLAGDYQIIKNEMLRLFPNTTYMEPILLPLVERYANEVATLYNRAPQRIFGGGTTPQPVFQKARELYSNSDINESLRKAQRKLAVQNTVILAAIPDRLRKFEVLSFSPHEATVDFGARLSCSNIQDAELVKLRIPVKSNDAETYFGYLCFSQQEIWLDAGDGVKQPIYNNSTENPFGFIPLVAIHRTEAAKGSFFSPVDQALLFETIGLSLALADLQHTVKHAAYPMKVIEPSADSTVTQEMVDELPTSPDRWIALPSMGTKLSVVHSNVQISEMVNYIESRMKHFAILRGMSPDAFLKTSAAKTAAARAFDKAQRESLKKPYIRLFDRAEQDLFKIIASIVNLTDPVRIPADAPVRIRHTEYMLGHNEQSEAQARQIAYQSGEMSPVEFIALRDNISRASALERLRRNESDKAAAASVPLANGSEGAGGASEDSPQPQALPDALNGAQVTAALTIVQAVAARLLPRSSGVQMLSSFFNLPPATAERVMADTGRSFFAATEETEATSQPED